MVLRIKKNIFKVWAIFLLVFPHINPACVQYMWPRIATLYDIGRIASMSVIVLMLLLKRNAKLQPVVLLIILMEVWLSFTTFIHGSQTLLRNLISFASAIAIPLIMYIYSDSMDELLTALFMNYEWMIYASLISIVLYFPYGMFQTGEIGRPQYFLGNENGIIFYALPALALSLIRMKKDGIKLRGLLLIIACIANEVIVWCATGIVGLFAAAVLLFYMYVKRRQINYYIILFGMLFADFLISILRILDRFWLTSYFVEEILGKAVTLSGRTYIWDAAMPIIFNNWLTGCGRGNHIASGIFMRHAHNQYFQILIVGGIPLLILFLILMFCYGRIFNNGNRNSFGKVVMLCMLTCLYIQFIATSRVSYEVYVPLALASFSKEIDSAINARIMKHVPE